MTRTALMTNRERIRQAIQFVETDSVPWQVNCTTPQADRLLRMIGVDPARSAADPFGLTRQRILDDFLGNHIVYVRNRSVNSVTEIRPGLWRDEWGVVWDRTIDKDIGTPVNSPLALASLPGVVPDADNPDRYAHVQPIIDAAADRYVLAKFSYSLFERAWSLRGMEDLFIDLAERPSFVHELMATITDFNLRIMTNLSQYRIDGIQFGDDWGSQKALLMSPEMWRQFVKPYAARLYARAHDLGFDVFIHSCGQIAAILDDLAEIGVDVVNPFQPEVLPVEELFRRFWGRLAFYGGLSVQKTLPFGTPDDVRREVRQRVSMASGRGGLILSPSHDVPPDVPLGNVTALLEAVRDQRKEPACSSRSG